MGHFIPPARKARAILARWCLTLTFAASVLGCGGRPFAEGGSREITIVTSLPDDSPEVLLLRAIVERQAIRIEDETAYEVRLATPEDPRAYRARTVVFLGYGPRKRIQKPLRSLAELFSKSRDPYVFSPDVWLRGQAVGLIWTESREDLMPALEHGQNRLFQALDRAVFATVRARLLALPRDAEAERRLKRVLGYGLRVPRGYEIFIEPKTRAALLVDEGPPTRLLRVAPVQAFAGADMRRARTMLAREFRPNERTLDLVEPTLTPDEFAGAVREIHGRWEDAVVSAAGPYRFYDVARGGRRFYVDLAVFAPGRAKLPYLRELQSIAETLTTR